MHKPEEIILAILGVLFIGGMAYFIHGYYALPLPFGLYSSLSIALWTITLFMLWKYNALTWLWPIWVGLFVACWFPLLGYWAQSTAAGQTDAFLLTTPWYDTWTTKIILFVAPTLIAYYAAYRLYQKKKTNII